ncbi:hypothetical protein EJ08DRAFT_730321 [Tothia fuscella]|uniref:Uncharacterized protein n=1 Tax=Tothia fuscella TaxID=1048955 RepID=A0A9P4P0V8_9PEZI|nr:hypothetical protein EJ08DRAFT_730321 [Tothia fuscella]
MNAGLEYANGKNANIDSGMWMHHMVMFAVGPGRVDATCGNNKASLPHMLIGSGGVGNERMFSSGNERTPALVPQWSGLTNVGYHPKATDKLAFIVDLMNENMEDKIAYLTMTFDYVPGDGAGFDDMRPVWFDAAQCSTSEVKAPKQSGAFMVAAKAWTANFEGEVVGSAGHMHDGGDHLTLDVSGTGVVCDSVASYGGSAEYTSKAMGHAHSATAHISKMSICMGNALKVKQLNKGQVWTLKAYYDYNKNKGMLHGDGKQATVMGIAIMYVRVRAGQTFGP